MNRVKTKNQLEIITKCGITNLGKRHINFVRRSLEFLNFQI